MNDKWVSQGIKISRYSISHHYHYIAEQLAPLFNLYLKKSKFHKNPGKHYPQTISQRLCLDKGGKLVYNNY